MFGLYERYIMPSLVSCACSSKPIMKQREKILPQAEGKVLEVGCGSGTNFALYDVDKVETVFGLEPHAPMIAKARKTEEGLGNGLNIEYLESGAESIPLDDNSIDTAVVTFVLCTIPDWQASLEEVRRVLKPGGRILFSEHGGSPDPNIAKWQRRWEPFQKALGGGCHVTRLPVEMLEQSGYKIETSEMMYLPNTPKVLGCAYWGSALPA